MIENKDSLDQALADARENVATLERVKITAIPLDVIKEFIERVANTSLEYRMFVSEREAMVRSNHGREWFRTRRAEWFRLGHARRNPHNPREWQYRLLIVPVAARISSVQSDAAKAAREA